MGCKIFRCWLWLTGQLRMFPRARVVWCCCCCLYYFLFVFQRVKRAHSAAFVGARHQAYLCVFLNFVLCVNVCLSVDGSLPVFDDGYI